MEPNPAASKSRPGNDPGKAGSSLAGPCGNETVKETEDSSALGQHPGRTGWAVGAGRCSDPTPAAQSSDIHKQGSRIPAKPGTTAANPENTSDKSKLRHVLQNT